MTALLGAIPKIFAIALLLASQLFWLAAAWAVMPDEILSDPVLETRARLISQDLRCLVCQNQSIDDSSAPLARDLRIIVRERLKQGETNEQVIGFLVERYGNYVLLKPPFQRDTWLLWFGPALVLLAAAGSATVYLFLRAYKDDGSDAPLNEAERRQVEELTAEMNKEP
jgi:cytochrome c-type biogenesis protein CcmH